MKKIILTTATILFINLSFAQTNFKWEKKDSVAKTKSKIYSDTKMFIAETWKSSKDVIQNDDKDGGIILIKGSVIQSQIGLGGWVYSYDYNYNVTFRMRENNYKINLDNVYCASAYNSGGGTLMKIEPFEGDNCPQTFTFFIPGINKKQAIVMMVSLKKNIQTIVDDYEKYIKASSSSNDGW